MRPEGGPIERKRAKVLIVDDHPVVRYGLLQMLGNEPDFEICGEAASAQEALALVDQRKPDVAVVDISLKGTNGIELVKQIHAMRPEARIRGPRPCRRSISTPAGRSSRWCRVRTFSQTQAQQTLCGEL